jgi:hypothetical protein
MKRIILSMKACMEQKNIASFMNLAECENVKCCFACASRKKLQIQIIWSASNLSARKFMAAHTTLKHNSHFVAFPLCVSAFETRGRFQMENSNQKCVYASLVYIPFAF